MPSSLIVLPGPGWSLRDPEEGITARRRCHASPWLSSHCPSRAPQRSVAMKYNNKVVNMRFITHTIKREVDGYI